MSDLLIRDLDPELLRRLKLRAKRRGRSLQAEVREILKNNTPLTVDEARERFAQVRAQLGGRKFSDSTDLVREDRDR